MNRARKTFSMLFIVLVLLLLFLPFITTFNELLTSIAIKFSWYRSIERIVVPFEIRAIVGVVKLLNIQAVGSTTSISVLKGTSWQRMWISWNCVGWQSAILLVISLLTGLQGNYKLGSKSETLVVGILGTYLINIIRMTLVVVIFKFFGYLPALIFHDYFANIMIIIWLFFFWWLSYTYILESETNMAS
jgi:exosortase/archaeosortase family protein